jgi:serine/threonine-protein kinase RsbW
MRLPSTPASLQAARMEAERRAVAAGMGESGAAMLAAAVHEAVTNAIEHGNRSDPSRFVTVEFESSEGRLTVRVRDEGQGIPSCTDDEDILGERGRGMRLMRALVDEVRIEEGRGEVVLIKAIQGP